MSAVGALLGLVLLIFELILVVRVVVDWVGVFAHGGGGGWSPSAAGPTR
jgi:YggT family protein